MSNKNFHVYCIMMKTNLIKARINYLCNFSVIYMYIYILVIGIASGVGKKGGLKCQNLVKRGIHDMCTSGQSDIIENTTRIASNVDWSTYLLSDGASIMTSD